MSWDDIIRKGVKAIAAQAKSLGEGLSDDELAKAKEELESYLAERSLTRAERTQTAFSELEQKLTKASTPLTRMPTPPINVEAGGKPVDLAAVITPSAPAVTAGTAAPAPPPGAAAIPQGPASNPPASPPTAAVTSPVAPVTGSAGGVTASAPAATVTSPAAPATVATGSAPSVPLQVAPPLQLVTPRERFRQELKALLQGDFPLITVIAAESTNSARDMQATVDTLGMKHIAIENIVEFSNIPKLLLNPAEVRHPTTVVIRDAQLYAENKSFIRGLRQLKSELPNQPRRIKVILQSCGDLALPGDLRYLPTLYFPLPDRADLEELIARTSGFIRERYHFPVSLDQATAERLANLLMGQTYEQATETLLRTALRAQRLDGSVLAEIEADKYKNLSNSALNYLAVTAEAAQVGGFENFRGFLELAHRTGVGEEALQRGQEPVKGVVMVGIPGAGKSQGAYMAAHILNLPLFRANIDAVLGKYVGESEAGLRDLLRQVDALGPSVIWIDEIEKALSGGSSESGVQAKLNGILLTWLQENRRVFIYATANDITRLPPEILRSGRLDKVFFVSLPNVQERELILAIHLRKRGLPCERFNLTELATIAEGYTGGEIEQAVKDAHREQGRDLTTDQLIVALDKVVPLSVSRAEEIRALEEWGATRAVSVSGDGTDSIFRARLVEWVPVDSEPGAEGGRRKADGVGAIPQSSFPGTRLREIFPGVPSGEIVLSPQSSLRNLQEWLRKRTHLNGEKAQALALQPPRGILVVGVPGTEQQAVAVTVARELERPLLKLGAERLVSDTETKLQTIDRVLQDQTLVVWIDDAPAELMERLIPWLGHYRRLFAIFTTNDPGHRLPASLLRGRIALSENRGLNEVFFVDLPGPAERETIFRDLLLSHHVPVADIDLAQVASASEGFSAQEAAVVVEEALIESLSDNGRPVTTADLLQALQTRIPGSKVRAAEIASIREWADQHALTAQ